MARRFPNRSGGKKERAAQVAAYAAVEKIQFDGAQFRRDTATNCLKVVTPMVIIMVVLSKRSSRADRWRWEIRCRQRRLSGL